MLLVISSILVILANNFKGVISKMREKIEVLEYVERVNDSDSGSDSEGEEKDRNSFYLVISKIDLFKRLREVGELENDISLGIQTIVNDLTEGNLILAAHSGNNYNAYFKDIDELRNGDKVIVYYKNYRYEYEIYKRGEFGKKIGLDREEIVFQDLLLVTCSDVSEGMQIVIYGKLGRREKIGS